MHSKIEFPMPVSYTHLICLFEEGLQPDDVRRLCLMACEHCSGTAAVFSGSDSSGYRYAVGNISVSYTHLYIHMFATSELNSFLYCIVYIEE